MKAILISIRPEWVEKIHNKQKEYEVRKTRPKKVPFKAYDFETKNSGGKGKVVSEWICDEVIEFWSDCNQPYWLKTKTCLTDEQVKEYGKGKLLYAYHITNLKVYDKPKELSEFKVKRKSCYYALPYDTKTYTECFRLIPLKRPPQSWCYVEELDKSNG